jgi:thymidylate kinase
MGALPLIVEFLGFPGGGKTTIARALTQFMREGEFLSSEQDRRLDGRLSAGYGSLIPRNLTEVSALCKGVHLLAGIRPFSIGRFKYLLLASNGPRRIRDCIQERNADCRIVFLDQWILQVVWSACAFAERVNSASLRKFVEVACAKPKRLVVFVEADAGLAAQRIMQRASHGSRFDRLNDREEIERRLQQSQNFFAEILAAVRASGSTVMSVPGSAPAEDNARTIFQMVKSLPALSEFRGSGDLYVGKELM